MSGSQGSGTRLSESVLGPAIVAITGMQLMATLDGTIVIVALPRMQAELALSDSGKSWVITVTGHGLKDPQWALRGADGADVTPRSVPFDVVTVAQALGLS